MYNYTISYSATFITLAAEVCGLNRFEFYQNSYIICVYKSLPKHSVFEMIKETSTMRALWCGRMKIILIFFFHLQSLSLILLSLE